MLRTSDPEIIRPYLKDASNLSGGFSCEVVFPENEEDVICIFDEACRTKTPVTISGNGTGLVGGRIPFGGIVLSTERLGGLKEVCTVGENAGYAITGPAITHKELQKFVSAKGLFYPPDPTEQNAFIGASVATNASGARTFKYGATRRWIRRLRVVLSTGDILELRRGGNAACNGNSLSLRGARNAFDVKLPHYRIPVGKHAAGYYVIPEMSAIDLFIGSEGTLGVFTEIELDLIPAPEELFSGIVFFPAETNAWLFADEIRKKSIKNRTVGARGQIDARAVEYFDSRSLNMLRSAYSHIPDDARSAIFFEQEMCPEIKKNLVGKWYELCRDNKALLDQSWFGQSVGEHAQYHTFRHAIPLIVNRTLKQHSQTKIGTDFSVPDERFFDVLELYREVAENSGLLYCIFGHIADNHVHVNFLPRNEQESEESRLVCRRIADQIIRWKGSVSAEHGIGKMKRDYLLDMYGSSGLHEMSLVKKQLDPSLVLCRGNIIPEELFNA